MTSLDGVRIFLIVVYIGLMIISIPGNALILWITWRNRNLQSPTNLLVCNLGLASVIVGIFRIPFIIQELVHPDISYPFSQSMCQFQAIISTASIMCISITLTTICVDRYIVIVHPLRLGWKLNKKKTYIVILASWIISLISFAPYASFSILYQYLNTIYCLPYWPETPYDINVTISAGHSHHFARIELSKFFVWLLFNLLVFLVPSIIMLTLYIRTVRTLWYNKNPSDFSYSSEHCLDQAYRMKQNRRAVKLLITCCAAFIVFNSPYFVIFMLLDFRLITLPRASQNILFNVLKAINYCSIAYNPIIYGYFNRSFRKHAPKWLLCNRYKQRFHKLRRNYDIRSIRTMDGEHSKLGLIDISSCKLDNSISVNKNEVIDQ